MRKLVLLLLLAFLPLQTAWAAAAGYCPHGQVHAADHFGHHEHRHQAVGDATPAEPVPSSGGEDADCGLCDLGCAQPLVGDAADFLPKPAPSNATAHDPPRWAKSARSTIDRPNWTAAA